MSRLETGIPGSDHHRAPEIGHVTTIRRIISARPMTAIEYVSKTDTIHIATTRQDGTEVVTPIWGVAVDGVPYIRSGYGDSSKWYQRVQHSGQLTLVDGRRRYPAKIENLTEENDIRKVDAAYEAKYRDQGSSLTAMVTADARRHTMRLVPQDG